MSNLGAGCKSTGQAVFVHLGHGDEKIVNYNIRPVVPEGTTIVSFTQPATGLGISSFDSILEEMNKYPDCFENPIQNKDFIEHKTQQEMRIYAAGSKMPALYYGPQLYFEGAQRPMLLKAGVYKLPLFFSNILKSGVVYPTGRTVSEDQIKHQLYQGEENKIFRDKILSDEFRNSNGEISIAALRDEGKLDYSAADAIEQFGPGVHYFLNCRGVKGLKKQVELFVNNIQNDLKERQNSLIELWFKGAKDEYVLSIRQILNNITNTFMNSIYRLQLQGSLPHTKLPALREILTKDMLDEEFQDPDENLIDYIDEGDVISINFLSPIQRKYLALFDEEFTPLLERLPLVRQLSNAGQRQYKSKGGKTRRKKTHKKRKV